MKEKDELIKFHWSPAVSTKEMGWYNSNILDSYLGGAWFESQSGDWLS
jgi:hypothetical protein